ncbi:MAG: chromosome partitioning protein ParB, partial [Burkholderiales bacterium]|nr:chromosome partitioning protein ParB [Opitutaceae bacterium]
MKKLLLPWLCFFACLLTASAPLFADDTHVPFRADLPAGAAFRIDARHLRPTQFAVGRRAVLDKQAKIDERSPAKLAAYLKKKDVPVVIGPGGLPYMADGHHTLNGLLRSRHTDKTAYGHILANWSDLAPDAFWTRMAELRYVYLKDELGRARVAAELPTSLLQLRDDPWRSLAGAVLDTGGYAERPDVFYQQFLWADFFRERVKWNDRDDADFARALREATALAREAAAS